MFSSKAQLDKKTGEYGVGRFSYLQSLVTEYQDTDSDDVLDEPDQKLVEYAIGGLCNCCLDKTIKQQIIQNDGVKLVIGCLSRPNEETVLSAITTLMFLTTPESKGEISSLPVVECMVRFSEANNKRLSNLADVFLQDYCPAHQVEEVKKMRCQSSAPRQSNEGT
ncbi:armadillo repeat-containing protein 7-like isoform X2 [Argopecten irradians]|uniref:armadillo repeat-containing protein 7-like isoform X2 n=1 Tax=Argopecten irradians TaxID=31199 RepID=UPI003711EA7C